MILVFGSINIDLVAPVASIPRPGETVLSAGYSTLFGGKGANQAVAAARIAGPGAVAMIGRVGDDAFGRLCRDNLARNGIAVERIGTDDALPTGCAFIVVDKAGENAITVASGANAGLDASACGDAPVQGCVGIFQMEVPLPGSLAMAERIKAARGTVVWNLAPVPDDLGTDDLRAILRRTDYLVVNELEALRASALLGREEEGFEAAAACVAREGATHCIVTAGARGAFVVGPDGTSRHVPARPIEPVDTTGAGDAFVGILAAGLSRGAGIEIACADACLGASLACLAFGAQPALPTRAELDAAR